MVESLLDSWQQCILHVPLQCLLLLYQDACGQCGDGCGLFRLHINLVLLLLCVDGKCWILCHVVVCEKDLWIHQGRIKKYENLFKLCMFALVVNFFCLKNVQNSKVLKKCKHFTC